MTYQFNQFSQKHEIIDFEIFLTSDCEYDDIMLGRIDFFEYLWQDEVEVKKFIASISFYIFNIYNIEDMLLLADSISGDLEYVASAYNTYCNEVRGIGSVAIIDEFNLADEAEDFYGKIQIIKYFLVKTIEKLQIIGTGTLLFMSKALILDINKSDRIYLINELLDINCIPIYQDESDVVLARNLDLTV
ncbi:hypothetical protein LV469_05770 [Peptoniphilus sp. GNH]|nr:hypothetical protein HMPREF3189_01214 [Clostridiales bacterium KA00134]UHR02155.1 hypothetical protein LV469_05770 [Peptoniphilus sp. GNH]